MTRPFSISAMVKSMRMPIGALGRSPGALGGGVSGPGGEERELLLGRAPRRGPRARRLAGHRRDRAPFGRQIAVLAAQVAPGEGVEPGIAPQPGEPREPLRPLPGEQDAQRLADQPPLGGEMPVEAAHGEAGARHHPLDAGPRDARASQQRPRGAEKAQASLLLVLGTIAHATNGMIVIISL